MIDWGFIAFLELVLFAAVIFAIVVIYGTRNAWRATPLGRLIFGFFSLVLIMLCGFISMALQLPFPEWLFAIVFAGLDFAAAGLLTQILRAQREEAGPAPPRRARRYNSIMDIKAWLYSGLRTGAQALWGLLAAYLAAKGIVLPEFLQGWFVDVVVVAGVIGAATAAIRWMETRNGEELWKRAVRWVAKMIMFGLSAKQPVYASPDNRAVSSTVTYANGAEAETLKE